MKNFLKYTKILSAVMLVMLISSTVLTSCDDDDDENTNVVLNSFGPVGVKHGETIKFIGLNLDKVTSIMLPGGVEVTGNAFSSRSSRVIELVVPQAAEAGKVILKTASGDIETKTPLSFEVPVVVTSIPEEAKPGTNISIKGTFVNWIEEIIFNDGVATSEFVSKSLNEVVVKVPLEAQTGFLIFNTGGTEPLTFASETQLTVIVPTFATVGPSALRHEENLTITGTDLDLITSVVFAGNVTATEFVSQSETELVVAVPSPAIKGTFTLKQASPIDIPVDEIITIILPVGTNVAPTVAIPGTDNITITGTNLDLIAELIMPEVDPIPAASFISHSATQIEVAVPEGTMSGGMLYTTIHGYTNLLGAKVIVPGGIVPLDYYIFDDELQNGWSEWGGWGHSTKDFANSEEVFNGEKAIKATFSETWGALQIGSPAGNVFDGYTTLSLRIFAPAAQNFIIQLNDLAEHPISVPQGWSVVDVPVSSLDGYQNVAELRLKNNSAAAPVTLYFDEIGLKQ